LNIRKGELCVKGILIQSVSKIEMSPITAKLKCSHGRGKDTDESEAVTEVRGDGFGRGREDNAEGGSGKDWNVLPADQTDSKEGSRESRPRAHPREYGKSVEPSDEVGDKGEGLKVIPEGVRGV
jgi:hypothetical protein